MGAGTVTELGVLAQTSRRALLVSINKYEYEYKQDRLNKEILDLKFEIDQMKLEGQKQLDAMFVVEIVLCIVVFLAGYATGKLL